MVHVYVTYPTQKLAETISSRILERHLAACINFSPVKAWYWWQGKLIKRPKETVSIISTQKKHVAKIEGLIRQLHSYRVPCILVLPVTGGYRKYIAWIHKETKA